MPTSPPKERWLFDIHVSTHARERMRGRSGMKAARIKDEVTAALVAGRLSASKPNGFTGPPHPDCLYAWNEHRCFVLKAVDNGFVVVTVVPL